MAAPGHFRPIRGARRNMRNTPPGLNQSDFSVFSQGSYMDDKTSKAATAERGKALAAALSQIEKQFGKGSVMRYGDNQVEHDIQVRSEEHTSELQSLIRNSYAVFCWKKKKQTPQQQTRS